MRGDTRDTRRLRWLSGSVPAGLPPLPLPNLSRSLWPRWPFLLGTLVPGVKDTDKANVFRLSVDYMAFLRSQFKDEDLAALDQKFCEQVQIKHLSDQSASLSITPVEAGTASASNSRPNSPQVTQQQAAASPSASVPLSASPSDFTQGSPVSFSPQQSPAQQLGMA